jgi:putative Mg2+ transporter-C (MgtC) family protein
LASGTVVLDPSRIAARSVTGSGFIGGGVIFVRKDLVRGLTTASAGHFAVMFGFPPPRVVSVTSGESLTSEA